MVDRPHRLILAAALAGLILRLAFAFGYWIDKPLTHDEREYLALAAGLQDGRGFSYRALEPGDMTPRFGRAPGYPLLLAAIGAGSDTASSTPARVKVAQAIVGALTVWLLGTIAMYSAGAKAGIVASSLAAIHPPLVWTSAYVLSEALYTCVAFTAAFVLQLAVDRAARGATPRAGAPLSLAAGALTGLAVLVRPAMLLFLPLAVLWLFRRRMTVLAIALVGASVAVIGPWTARNLSVYGRFVLVASEGGVTFWTGNHPLARGEGDLAANPELQQAHVRFLQAHAGLTPEELEPFYYADALRHISDRPGWWLQLLVRKAFYTFVPVGPSYTLHSARYRLASIIPYVLLLPFAVAGALRLWIGSRPPTSISLLALSAVVVSLVFFPQERFRIPVLDPTLIICAAGLALPAGELLRSQRSRSTR
jgi:4-amino-4-deoxy-L-arabinose transferase-like glycosyltransferase